MKTDILHADQSIKLDAISLDGFIVKETLAKDVLVRGTERPKTLFTAADLWNIHRNGRRSGWRK